MDDDAKENHNDDQNEFREPTSKRMRKSGGSHQYNQPSTSKAEIDIHDGESFGITDRPLASRRHDPRESRNTPPALNDRKYVFSVFHSGEDSTGFQKKKKAAQFGKRFRSDTGPASICANKDGSKEKAGTNERGGRK